jgi:hypothetical protein
LECRLHLIGRNIVPGTLDSGEIVIAPFAFMLEHLALCLRRIEIHCYEWLMRSIIILNYI